MIATIIVVMLLGVPLGYLLSRQCKRLRSRRGQVPWRLLFMAAVAGGGLGLLVNQCQLPLGHSLRVMGFPVPGVFFHLEDGQWVDFVAPFPWLNMVTDICLFCLSGAVAVALALGRRKVSQQFQAIAGKSDSG